MYQALYRKWRPRTFDDVVGQEHITETLKRQVAQGRLSHAYLFTGTRGTGKTTCAKILARAVNCEHPVDGNPCNCCPACLGIENGSVLDVLELDAASNNGVDQIRALRDEAIYTPAAVRKRVYIVDEVHMLSVPAFNALLKILEEPPAHLMFILATTELHKVPATIKSRCQQFAFKRITPRAIADQLGRIAQKEGLALTPDGADLLARLADGGLRDALSLLDQCSGGEGEISEDTVLGVLGLTGNRRTAQLLGCIAREDTPAALEILADLYQEGKDMGALLGELAALIRDLLIRKTAPEGGRGLLTGGYDEKTIRPLLEGFTAAELVQMLKIIQSAQADLYRSASRRLDAELCLIRLCDRRLSDSVAGLTARISRLEQQMARGVIPAQPVQAQEAPATPAQSQPKEPPKPQKAPAPPRQPEGERENAPAPAKVPPWESEAPPPWEDADIPPDPAEDLPPWEEPAPATPAPAENRPTPAAPPQPKREPVTPPPPPQPAPAPASGQEVTWEQLAASLTDLPGLPDSVRSYLRTPNFVVGVFDADGLTMWVGDDLIHGLFANNHMNERVAQAMEAMGMPKRRVQCKVGKPPETPPAGQAVPADPYQSVLGLADQFSNFKRI